MKSVLRGSRPGPGHFTSRAETFVFLYSSLLKYCKKYPPLALGHGTWDQGLQGGNPGKGGLFFELGQGQALSKDFIQIWIPE